MNSDKKSGNILLIVITVLLIVLIGIGGVLIYQNLRDDRQVTNEDSSENKKEDNNNEFIKTENLGLDSTIVENLSKVFFQKYLTTEVSSYDNYFYRNKKTDVSSISDDFKTIITFRYLDSPEVVSREAFENTFKQIFGNNVSVPSFSMIEDCVSGYMFNNSTNSYEKNAGCGSAIVNYSSSKLLEARRVKDDGVESIVIKEAVVFVIRDSDGQIKLYKDFEGETSIISGKEFIIEIDENDNLFSNDYAEYEYTFVKDSNDIYVFTSVERIK